jgi:autophagy-related protein 2
VSIHLHEGYDWQKTRKVIREESKAVRRRLQRIRQLVANGQMPDENVDEVSTTLFSSVHLGLPSGAGELSPKELLAAIDDELDDPETSSQANSWETLPDRPRARPTSSSPPPPHAAQVRPRRPRLDRSSGPAIEFNLRGVEVQFDKFGPADEVGSRLDVRGETCEIIDDIKSSTWRKFLSELRLSEGGLLRPTGGPMFRAELTTVRSASAPLSSDQVLLKVRNTVYNRIIRILPDLASG